MPLPSNVVQIQGQGQVSADALNSYLQSCTTAPKLRNFVGVTGMQVSLLGLTVVGDGGGGLFYWVVGSNFTDDNDSVIVPIGYTNGAWLRVPTSSADVTWLFGLNNVNGATSMFTPAGFYGVASDGVTNDTAAMITALTALGAAGGGALVLPPNSTTLITPGQLSIPPNVVVMSFGSHNPNSPSSAAVILAASASTAPLLQVDGTAGRIRGWGLRNLMLNCAGLCPGFQAFRTDSDILVECVTVINAAGYGWKCFNCWDASFINLVISNSGDPVAHVAALEIAPEPTQDNCNALKFYGLRVEGSTFANMAIRGNTNGGPSNNLFFHGCKFHLRNNGTGTTANAPNCIFESADTVSFHGCFFFDGGSSQSMLLFQDASPSNYANYVFDGCNIDSLIAPALIGTTTTNTGFNITLHKCELSKDFANVGTLIGINLNSGGLAFAGTFQNFAPYWLNFGGGDTKYTGSGVTAKNSPIKNIISGAMLNDLAVNWQIGCPGNFGAVVNPPPRVAFSGPVTHTLTEAEIEAACIFCNAHGGAVTLTLPDGNTPNSATSRSWFTRFLRYDGDSGGTHTVTINAANPVSGQQYINGSPNTSYTLAAGFMTFIDFLWDHTTGNWFAMSSPAPAGTPPGGWPPAPP